MFLVATVPKEEISHLARGEVRQFDPQRRDQKISVVTDGHFSTVEPDEQGGFLLVEKPSAASDTTYVEVHFDASGYSLAVTRQTVSGRPVYHSIDDEGDFYCSSHVRLLRKAGLPLREETDVLPEYFMYRFVMPPRTLYCGISRLQSGGHIMIQGSRGGWKVIEEDEYHPPEPSKKETAEPLPVIAGHALQSLEKSLKKLNAERKDLSVPLSGGLDSTILYRICQNLYGTERSCSTGFPFESEKNNKERRYALSAAKELGANHRYYRASTNDYLHGVISSIAAAEEPVHHLQSVMLYLLFGQGMPESKRLVVSGEGADSVFGNSLHNNIHRGKSWKYRALRNYVGLRIVWGLSKLTGKGQTIFEVLRRDEKLPLDSPENIVWTMGAYGCGSWIRNRYGVSNEDIIEGRREYMSNFETRTLYDQIALLAHKGEGVITTEIWSKLGESQGKVVHYPFNEENLLSHAFSSPWDVKLNKPKNVLREVARQLDVPSFIITRGKSSFGVRHKQWAVKGGVFEPLVALAAKEVDIQQLRLLQQTQASKAYTFWNLINYALWRRIFIRGESEKALHRELEAAIEKCKS